jgi:hypothetical protein
MGSDASDLIAIGKSEPKITIRPHRDREGLAASPNGEALGVRCFVGRHRLGGGGAQAEREQGQAEGKFGSDCVAKGGEYRPGLIRSDENLLSCAEFSRDRRTRKRAKGSTVVTFARVEVPECGRGGGGRCWSWIPADVSRFTVACLLKQT